MLRVAEVASARFADQLQVGLHDVRTSTEGEAAEFGDVHRISVARPGHFAADAKVSAPCFSAGRISSGAVAAQVRHDAVNNSRGVALAPIDGLHHGSLRGVAHVAELDERGRVLGQV